MAKHSTKPSAVYEPTFHKSLDVSDNLSYMEALNRAVDKANNILGPNPRRWERTQDAFLLAVKYFNTPDNRYFLDQFIMKSSEEIWNTLEKRFFEVSGDRRQSEKMANQAVEAFEEFFE